VNQITRQKDEYLERLWCMKERGESSLGSLESAMEGDFQAHVVDDLLMEGLVEVDQSNGYIKLTVRGDDRARQIIRAHRIGERLLYDVFGGDFETGACELEHIVTEEIVDGICILLGHPRECPHGMPIPEGDCCRRSAQTVHNLVIPVSDLDVGQCARVAYIQYKDDHQMHRIDGLQIRPGTAVKLRQKYPCCVIECEGSSIAMDGEIAANIRVWSNGKGLQCHGSQAASTTKNGRGWAGMLGFGRK
jgi:DtxR family Mn-dependent transcriptional regulator